jgi:hypothetical protein
MRILPFRGVINGKLRTPGVWHCRAEKSGTVIEGAVGLIDLKEVGKSIFPHEQLLTEKIVAYKDSFFTEKRQLTPVMIGIQDREKFLHGSEIFSTKCNAGWKWTVSQIHETSKVQNHFSSKNGLILDGHHRVFASLLYKAQYLSAWFIPVTDVCKGWILRTYEHVGAAHPVFEFFRQNGSLCDNSFPAKNFSLMLGDTMLTLNSNVNERVVLDILAGVGRFENSLWIGQPCSNKKLNVLIPPVHVPTDKILPLPPHSTYFYPKIPAGLISRNL